MILHCVYKHKKFHGQIALMYCAWYGFGCILIDGFRAESLLIANTAIRAAQCVGTLCVAVSTVLLVIFCRRYCTYEPLAQPAVPHVDDTEWHNKESNPFSRALEHVLMKRKNKKEENQNDGNKN